MSVCFSRSRPFPSRAILTLLVAVPLLAGLWTLPASAQQSALAATPPMGWNDWAHYECRINEQVILSNARALVKTGLAAHGYDTVTIDDCWMQKDRDAKGDLQPDLRLFPHGIKPVAQAVHALGLRFGIYEDAGYATCGGFAGSGVPRGGGKDHFLQDAKLFASWGVDYLKLDGCNVYVPHGSSKEEAYRSAYAAEQSALRQVGRPIVFSESAPAYFQGTPDWYTVLDWVRHYGQLWREGSDIEVFDPKNPNADRFRSVLWNYSYNLPLGRFQSSGNWNDADFIIGGDSGVSQAEARSQLALWSMMSAPLILSSDLAQIGPQALAILSNRAVIAVDQDKLGRMATLIRRTPAMDLLLKPLAGGSYAVAVLNRGAAPMDVSVTPAELGFAGGSACHLQARDLWSGQTQSSLRTRLVSQDTAIWRVEPSAACGKAARTGAITMTAPDEYRKIDGYARCLAATGYTEACAGTPDQLWTVTAAGALQSGNRCLAVTGGRLAMRNCSGAADEHWQYTLAGNLVSANHACLTGADSGTAKEGLTLQPCAGNQLTQIWSLPN